nr:2-C-methyl-D-erythritol 4-phosphate cytidylyltransferase [Anaeromicropila populeti]
MKKNKVAAIVLAAGQGRRMNSSVPKQYLVLNDKPVLYYALKVFEDSLVDEIVLVTGKNQIDYCKENIVEKYHFQKVVSIVEGGKERYDSVRIGLNAIKNADYVYIHDGARPFVTNCMIEKTYSAVQKEGACVVGVPVKDTIKIADQSDYVVETPRREFVWTVQTPQVFEYQLILNAYEKLSWNKAADVTDDAMVLESMTGHKVKLVMGSYENMKITTPEDLVIAEAFFKCRHKKED